MDSSDFQQSDQRDRYATFLQQVLEININKFIDSKAQEDVLTRIMNNHLQEFEKNKELLENPVVQLKARNNELNQQVNIETVRLTETKQEFETVQEMEIKAIEHYKNLKEQFKIIDHSMKQMEQEYNKQIQNYKTEKLQLQELIDKEDKNLLDPHELIQKDAIKYRKDFEEKTNALQTIKGTNTQIMNKINELNKKTNDLKLKIKPNEDVLPKKTSQEEFMRNCLNNTNLQVAALEMQLKNDEAQHANSLKALNAGMKSFTERLENYSQREIILQEQIINKINLAHEYELTQAKLEEEHLMLLSTFKKLTDIFESVKNESARKIKLKGDEVIAYKMKLESIYKKNVQYYNNKLQEHQNRLTERKNYLAATEERNNELHKSIAHYEALNEKLKKEYELKASSSFANVITSKPIHRDVTIKSLVKSSKRHFIPSKTASFSEESTKLVSTGASNVTVKRLRTTSDSD